MGSITEPVPTTPPATVRYVLRSLPLSARLVLTAFLLSVGLGYAAALVQLHFQHAEPGQLFPGRDETYKVFHDERGRNAEPASRPVGRLETLIAAAPTEKFGSNGQMSAAFTNDKAEMRRSLKGFKKAHPDLDDDQAEAALLAEREGERQAVLAWLAAGAPQDAYDKDAFPLPEARKGQPITGSFCPDGRTAKVKSILDARCVRCHGKDGEQEDKPLDSFVGLKKYLPEKVDTPNLQAAQPKLSLTKLAQSTHVHLLSFSVLYALTGLILAFSRLPSLFKWLLCPLPLVVQAADIACWWLARLDKPLGPYFADAIPITGGVVGLGLLLHIFVSTFDMYGWLGKAVLALLFAGAVGAALVFLVTPAPLDSDVYQTARGWRQSAGLPVPYMDRQLEKEKAEDAACQAAKKGAEKTTEPVKQADQAREENQRGPARRDVPPGQ